MLIRGGMARHLGIRGPSGNATLCLMGLSVTGKVIYQAAAGVWTLFGTQIPAIIGGTTVGALSYAFVGDSKGNLIDYAHGCTKFAHYSVATDSWSLKNKATAGIGVLSSAFWVSDTEIYAVGNGLVEKYNGSTWSNLTPSGALDGTGGWVSHGLSDNVWVANLTGTVHLWHYTTAAGWVDNVASIPLLGGFALNRITGIHVSPTGCVYIFCASAANKAYLVKFDGASTWSILNSAFWLAWGKEPGGVFALDDTHIWMNGYDNDNFSGHGSAATFFCNGTTVTRQKLGTGIYSVSPYAWGKTLIGLVDGVTLASCAHTTNKANPINDHLDTLDGATWNYPASWPDANVLETLTTTLPA